MSTPRTDKVAVLPYPANIPALVAHARQLETELNACRKKLALLHDGAAEAAAQFPEHPMMARQYSIATATAAHLRDLKSPLDVSRL